jgi:hypothetical protein
MKLVIFAVEDIEYSAGRWIWPQKVTRTSVAMMLRAASVAFCT